jgi:hypothetical protein
MAQCAFSAVVNQDPIIVRVEIPAYECDALQTRKGGSLDRDLDHGRARPGPSR